MSTVEAYRKKLKQGVSRTLDDLIDSGAVTDFSEASLKANAHAITEAVQSVNRVNDRIGPFYSSRRVESLLGVSRQAVSERARNHRLLRVTTSDGVKVFPSFQFNAGGVRSNLVPLIEVLLGSDADPWTVAYWLTAPQAHFNDRTAVEVVDEGEGAQRKLLALARDDAAAWRPDPA